MEHGESSKTNRMLRKRKINHKDDVNDNVQNITDGSLLSDFGLPKFRCQFCGAMFWYEERLKSISITKDPVYSLCCRQGKIFLPLLKPAPPILQDLLHSQNSTKVRLFKKNIRIYNSMFAFTSIGAHIDHISGPYIIRLNGQNHHKIGSLLPIDGKPPQFAQLYIYDTEHEVDNRIATFESNSTTDTIDRCIIEDLIKMFDAENQIVQHFRYARDCFNKHDFQKIQLHLCEKRPDDTLQYNKETQPEIAALIVDDFGQGHQHRDIIIEDINQDLHRISDLHPSFMALQYPLLFPYGEDGYRLNIPYRNLTSNKRTKRENMTMKEFYAHRIQQRDDEITALIQGGRLLQQYIVDSFSCIEEDRLQYIRTNQISLRSEILKGIQDAFYKGDTSGNDIGMRIILPSSFTGSQRYMIKNYHDAMAMCRTLGHPDLFITFTCNVKWPEIQSALQMIPNQRPEDRPDIVSRVFKLKLEQLMSDIRKHNHFGKVVGAIYTIEFQKRGLPHVHIIIWLDAAHKYPQPNDIDKIISAEIPDKYLYPYLYELVTKHMIHGPCGAEHAKAPCTINNKCSKQFPKDFNVETRIDENGYAVYKRRPNDIYIEKNKVHMDNRHVVPYNDKLLLKYQAHINVEWCNKSTAIMYLFKYINKGPDRTRASITLEKNDATSLTNTAVAQGGKNEHDLRIGKPKQVDEVTQYLDCRYLSAYEAIWRIFEFHIHFKNPTVECLTVHLPLMNNVVYHSNRPLASLIEQPDIQKTMFTEWMQTNSVCADARELDYTSFPSQWIWNSKHKVWNKRKNKGYSIGRIAYIHPASGELYYLRMLLNVVRGPQKYDDIKTVDSIVHLTFKLACRALGLLGDDKEWDDALNEAAKWSTPSALRELFVTMVIFCEVGDPMKLLQLHWKDFGEDILKNLQKILHLPHLSLPEKEIQNHTLMELERLFNKNNTSLNQYELPMPSKTFLDRLENRLIFEELDYNTNQLNDEHRFLTAQLNMEQAEVYRAVLHAVYLKTGDLFFVYGHGGTGKTFLYQAIIAKLRSEGKLVLTVASSGIASLLLPGGRTAHSRFKIPINIDDVSTCQIKKNTQLAKPISQTSLIVWDEAPMTHRHCFEAVDKSLQDILNLSTEDNNSKPFGGITVLLGGDFRQILPVIVNGTRHDTVNACITKSYLWRICRLYILKANMRLSMKGLDENERNKMTSFAEWILAIGDGKLGSKKNPGDEDNNWTQIPSELLIQSQGNDVEAIASTVYDNLIEFYNNVTYLKERSIVTATNEDVDTINKYLMSLIPTEKKTYLSFDTISTTSTCVDEQETLYDTTLLNSLKPNGIPEHALDLKVDTPIMLLRNIDQSSGLCNGTRLIVKRLGTKVIEAEIISNTHCGTRVCIPRIVMSAKETKWPFVLKRRQFPVRICYAMTINKSQGQTLQKVGLYLPKPVFSHGQLYVALSRVTSYKGLKILLKNDDDDLAGFTRNIVYTEIFENLS